MADAATQEGEDTKILEASFKKDVERETIKQQRRVIRILGFVVAILAVLVLGSLGYNYYTHSQTAEIISTSYQTMLQGMYSVQKTAADEVTPRDIRVSNYMRKAKRIILNHNPKTDFTDPQLNQMLEMNWELAEMYSWSPYWVLAYGAEETDFTNNPLHPKSSAKGWLQWFAGSMRETMGDMYVPGMEKDPIWSLKAWYKRMGIAAQAMDNDPLWMACYYMLPDAAVMAKAQGKTVKQFMHWLAQMYPGNDEMYPEHIKRYFDQYESEE
jgi:hypothetical protein